MGKENIGKVENALVDFVCKTAEGETFSENTWQAIPETVHVLLEIWKLNDN